jgi:hypothetical protein
MALDFEVFHGEPNLLFLQTVFSSEGGFRDI